MALSISIIRSIRPRMPKVSCICVNPHALALVTEHIIFLNLKVLLFFLFFVANLVLFNLAQLVLGVSVV